MFGDSMFSGLKQKPGHVADVFIVTVDFDDTLAYRQHLKVEFARKLFGIDISLEQGKEDTFPLGAQKYKEMKPLIEKAVDRYELMPDCHDVLWNLQARSFRFAVVTSRTGKEDLKLTEDFIKRHQLPINYFHATNSLPKDYICNRLRSRAMIDDIYKNLEKLSNTSVKLFFLKHSWNAREIPAFPQQDITIVNNWIEFGNELLKLKELHEAICYFNGWENNFKNVPRIAEFAKRHHSESYELVDNYRKAPANA